MIDMTDEQIAEDRIMRNTNFVDDAVDTAIQLVVDVDNALMDFKDIDGQTMTDEKRREYLPLVLDLLHRSNVRDDARSNRRLHAGALGMSGFPESDCDL